jgi:transposase
MDVDRKLYPSDVSDEEWSLVAGYLTLQREDSGQREHSLREVFNGLRYIVKTGAPWRWMPNDLPPWAAVYQQTQRWLAAGCFEALVDDLRAVLRLAAGRKAEPSAEDRGEVEHLAQAIQAVTDDGVEIAWVDQGYTGARAERAAARHGIELKVVKLPEAKRGFILLPRRWVVERSFAWATRFRRLIKDYERYAETLAGLHLVAFVTLMLKQAAEIAAGS